ncbi:MAG: TIGR00282 family metallophosphoesterase [Candidatus Omnitrophica bacterium]|nr:TIGR00282 family metallophosphoesterase [Candidatus Omnitrophota bacterium]MDD5488217.1 TIGR00282 family metallophosphoesterase [Candidatus Omnitrophota bacterium]
MRILFIGDIVGKPGRDVVRDKLEYVRQREGIDLVIANGENAAAGSGLTPSITNELFSNGVDIVTSGDHIWKRREIYDVLEKDKRILRPLNYPEGAPGRGAVTIDTRTMGKIGIVNIVGRVFMDAVECPFRKVKHAVEKIRKETHVIIVDMHAEATSEKVAMGWYLDGLVTAVVGTHTHIQTADEKILPGGTAYITDCGMTGPYDSVIGRVKENVIERFVSQLPTRFDVADKGVEMHGVIIDMDAVTGKATAIKRIQEKGANLTI